MPRQIEMEYKMKIVSMYLRTIIFDAVMVFLILSIIKWIFGMEGAILFGIAILITIMNIGTFPIFDKKKAVEDQLNK